MLLWNIYIILLYTIYVYIYIIILLYILQWKGHKQHIMSSNPGTRPLLLSCDLTPRRASRPRWLFLWPKPAWHFWRPLSEKTTSEGRKISKKKNEVRLWPPCLESYHINDDDDDDDYYYSFIFWIQQHLPWLSDNYHMKSVWSYWLVKDLGTCAWRSCPGLRSASRCRGHLALLQPVDPAENVLFMFMW